MKITVLTLFPQMFEGPLNHSIVKRAIEKKLVEIDLVNIRDFGEGRHKIVDDRPYGGGTGMIMRVDILHKALQSIKKRGKRQKSILLTPQGKNFVQKEAIKLSKIDHIILVCGHYEGTDARFEKFVDEKYSVGDFVTTGGEIPAMLIIDSVVRLLPGVLKKDATARESFPNALEYPQYTKPRSYKNLNVPKVLLSGNHKKIEEFKKIQSKKITIKLRPDLIVPREKTQEKHL